MRAFISLFLCTVGVAFSAHAAFDIQPGLWKIDSTIESEGKTVKPQEQLNKALEQMPPEQRKQVMEMMNKMSNKEGKGGIVDASTLCLTKEMIQKESMLKDKDGHCNYTEKTRTSKKLAGSFTCKDGTKGEMDWDLISSKEYKGLLNMTDKTGKHSKMNYHAKFVSGKCP